VAHKVFGGFWDAIGSTSFEVLVSPPSPSSVGRAVGLSSRLSKTPLGTGAQVDAITERSSAAELSARGTCCSSRAVKSFSSFLVAATLPVDLLDDQLGVPLHQEMVDPQG
jgi:hypothetical protein